MCHCHLLVHVYACVPACLSAVHTQGPSGLHQYRLRTLFDEVPLPPDWPVLVNFHEAKAFATWKSTRENEVSECPLLGKAHYTRGRVEPILIVNILQHNFKNARRWKHLDNTCEKSDWIRRFRRRDSGSTLQCEQHCWRTLLSLCILLTSPAC